MSRSLRAVVLGTPLLAVMPGTAPAQDRLPEVVVTAPAIPADQVGPVVGYQALTSGVATRTNTPIEQIPQSVTVIPRSLFTDQGAITLDEALRNAASVVPESPLFLNQNLNTLVRGFPAEIYRDGLQSYFDLGLSQSLFGVERIDIIRGPSGGLFGGGQGGGFGGVVNITSQQPLPRDSYAAGINLGPYGYRNPWIDVNRAYTDRAGVTYAARVQAEHLSSRSYIDNVNTTGMQILPSVSVTTDRSRLVLQGFYSERRANDYPGLPPEFYNGTSRLPVGRFTNANGANVPRTDTTRSGLRLNFDHRLDEVFTIRLAAQVQSSNINQPSQFPFGGVAIPPTTYARFNGYLGQDLLQFSAVPSIEARFTTGVAQHVAIAGLDLDHTRDQGLLDFGDPSLFDFASPSQQAWSRPAGAAIPLTRNTYSTTAAFVQDQVTLWDRVHLLGALRVTNLDIKTEALDTATAISSSTTRVTGRAGVGVEVIQGVTPFIGWGNSIRSPGGYAFGGFVTPPKPEEGEQLEAGVKLNLPFGLSGTAAWFEIQRSNVPYFDLAAGGNRQIGEQRSRGVDFDLLWQPDRQFSLLGSYAYTVAETVSDSTIAAGTPLRLVPRNAGRVWANYRLRDLPVPEWMQGLSFGGGVTSVAGANTSSLPNAVRVDGYTIVDASVGYDAGPVSLRLSGRNLGNARYVIPFSYFENAIAPGAPRSVYLSASVRF